MTETPTELLKQVSWEKLEEWAGSRSVGRGERYQRGGRVKNMRVTSKDDDDLRNLKNPAYDDDAIEDDDLDSNDGDDADYHEQPSPRASLARNSRPKGGLAGGNVSRIVSSLRREIANVTSEPSWRSHWSDEGEVADLSRIEKNMQGLLDQGHYEAMLQVGDELVATAIDYVETCDDDGDVASQVTDCLNIAFKALHGGYDTAGASAIEKSYPERALGIWRRMAEHQISLTKPSAYETAVGHLKRVKAAMIRLGKEKEWGSYLAALRDANHRKPRCIQELRRLSGLRLLN